MHRGSMKVGVDKVQNKEIAVRQATEYFSIPKSSLNYRLM
jgi:hypothetical protein